MAAAGAQAIGLDEGEVGGQSGANGFIVVAEEMGSGPGNFAAFERTIDSAKAVVAPEIPSGPELAVDGVAGIGEPEGAEGGVATLRANARGVAHLDQEKVGIVRGVLPAYV